MSTEATLDPVIDTSTADSAITDFTQQAGMDFDKAMQERNKAPEVEAESTVIQPVKTEVKKEAEPQKIDNDFPAELLGEKPVVEKAVTIDPLDEIKLAANASPKSHEQFAKVLAVAKQERQQAAELKSKLEAVEAERAKAPAADPQVAEKLKAYEVKIAELEQVVEREAFTQTPKFKAISQDIEAQVEAAKSYLEGTEIDKSVVERASYATGAKRLAILKESGMEPEMIAAVNGHLAQADVMARNRDSALSSHKETRAAWEAEQRQVNEGKEIARKAQEETVFTSTLANVSKVFEPFMEVPGNDKWNAQAAQLRAEAKEYFNGNKSLDEVAEITAYGVGAKVIHKMNHALRGMLKERDATIAKLTAAQPGGGTENQETKPVTTGDFAKDAGRDFDARLSGMRNGG